MSASRIIRTSRFALRSLADGVALPPTRLRDQPDISIWVLFDLPFDLGPRVITGAALDEDELRRSPHVRQTVDERGDVAASFRAGETTVTPAS